MRAAAIALGLCLLAAPVAAQSARASDQAIDLAVVRLERALLGDDPHRALEEITNLRRLAPEIAGGDLLYFEARLAGAVGDHSRQRRMLRHYFDDAAPDSPYRQAALMMMVDIEEAEAQASADRVRAGQTRARIADLDRALAVIQIEIDREDINRQRAAARRDELGGYVSRDRDRQHRLCHSPGNWIRAAVEYGVNRVLSAAHCDDLFERRDRNFRANTRDYSLASSAVRDIERRIEDLRRRQQPHMRERAALLRELEFLDP